MTRCGRVPGVENYSSDDLDKLLQCTSNVLPTSANEWESVRACYENYAAENDRVDRERVSLKKKFQALLNCKKPTGDAQCPNSV
ncbi:hypothetical protein PHMEG_00017479 [Phytophthora megakarya]|uniref:DUF6818 domain-containing protein n=1 Tax=Phytophthora megakarya TaxID=4795 RepID=A0A225VXY7_9STRA|nr:hypothetical protein PHMEG_00017479 [Phytophthora megakarya]